MDSDDDGLNIEIKATIDYDFEKKEFFLAELDVKKDPEPKLKPKQPARNRRLVAKSASVRPAD